jgi:hypothetical protein
VQIADATKKFSSAVVSVAFSAMGQSVQGEGERVSDQGVSPEDKDFAENSELF